MENTNNTYQYEGIDGMEGHSFEYFCAALLKKNGFHSVKVTQGSGDFGVDVLAKRHGKSYAIQVKNYSSHVGIKAVQEAHLGKSYYNCDKAVVMTNNYFTQAAKEAAEKVDVELWDRKTLTPWLKNAFPNSHLFDKAKRKSKRKSNKKCFSQPKRKCRRKMKKKYRKQIFGIVSLLLVCVLTAFIIRNFESVIQFIVGIRELL